MVGASSCFISSLAVLLNIDCVLIGGGWDAVQCLPPPPPREDDELPDAVSCDSSVISHNYSPQLTCILFAH